MDLVVAADAHLIDVVVIHAQFEVLEIHAQLVVGADNDNKITDMARNGCTSTIGYVTAVRCRVMHIACWQRR